MTHAETQSYGFTAGICATGHSPVAGLAASLIAEAEAHSLPLLKLVVVASECPESVLSELKELETGDGRVQILVEAKRRGKAEAVNRILMRARGEFVVMVNADASPEPGAMARLLSTIRADPCVGVVSAMPVVGAVNGVSSLLVDMIWRTHNESSRLLNHLNLSNHSSEELAVFRLSAISMLPRGLVNDGAFLASVARRRGYTVKFSDLARVRIDTPAKVSDLIAQRRRILFGHAQVWRKAGKPPKTIESLLLFTPSIGLPLFVQIVARSPRFLLILPLAFVTEVSAALLSIKDAITSTNEHAVWRRVT